MTSAGGPPEGGQVPPVDLSKPAGSTESTESEPFDPYRFGKPDTPPPPQYAPPGYVPDPPPAGTPPPDTSQPGYPGAPGPSGYGGGYPPMPPQYGPPQSPQYGSPQSPQYGPPPYGGPPPHQGQYPGQYPGQPGYGVPPYAPQYPGTGQGNGKAIAGMVLGIVSIVLCWASFVNLAVIIPGIVFSLLGLNESKRRGTGRGMAITGLVCVAVGVVLTVLLTIFYIHLSDDCSGIERGTNAYNRCVRDSI